MPVIDPLGLQRCVVCSNAFVLDADRRVTARARKLGLIEPEDFVCRWCANREDVQRALRRAAAAVRR